jgi:hypothetical protein
LHEIKFDGEDLAGRIDLLAFGRQPAKTIHTSGKGDDLVPLVFAECFYQFCPDSLACACYDDIHGSVYYLKDKSTNNFKKSVSGKAN